MKVKDGRLAASHGVISVLDQIRLDFDVVTGGQ